jgi:Alpha-mannosidase
MLQDRYSPRIDQGERIFSFWLNGGKLEERLTHIDREALVHNEKPYALSFYPSGEGTKAYALAELKDDTVQVTAFKKAEANDGYIIRLFEPTGQERNTLLSIPIIGLEQQVNLKKFEIKTLKLDFKAGTLMEVDMMENSYI